MLLARLRRESQHHFVRLDTQQTTDAGTGRQVEWWHVIVRTEREKWKHSGPDLQRVLVQALGHLRGLTEARRAARKPDGHVP